MAPAAQVAWVEKHVDDLVAENERLREALEEVVGQWEYDGDISRPQYEGLKALLAADRKRA